MARKNEPDGESSRKGKPRGVRFEPEVEERIEEAGKILGIGFVNLVRLIINENLETYEGRADKIKAAAQQAKQRTAQPKTQHRTH